MSETATEEDDRRTRRIAFAELAKRHGATPEGYRAVAGWWRVFSEDSADPTTSLSYAENLEALATDVEARPAFYRGTPPGQTHWQRFKTP